MKELKRIGGYLEVDEDGFIVKQASIDKIASKWKPIIEEAISSYKQHYGSNLLSVYVRGSVAKGDAIDGISDLDTIAILNSNQKIDALWGDAFSDEMIKKYPFIEKVEVLAGTREQAVDLNRGVHIMLKTQSVCVYGKDISDEIPKLRPGKESCRHFRSLQSDLQKSIDFFENKWGKDSDDNRKQCRWIMKRILRTGFELVMERERKYTRDLFPCYESFSKYFSEKQELMRTSLNFAVNPTDQMSDVLPVLRDWFVWMPQEIEKVFNFKKAGGGRLLQRTGISA